MYYTEDMNVDGILVEKLCLGIGFLKLYPGLRLNHNYSKFSSYNYNLSIFDSIQSNCL